VFDALTMLTDTVILFDEFDSVLRRRLPNTKIENIFEFLTPGMLPKLKKLHTEAKTRRVVYILATNLVGDLDEAAIRPGRFDAKVGLYPPDLLSRTGRLLTEALRVNPLSREAVDRAVKVIRATGSGGMTQLSKEGWLRAGKGKPAEGTPLHFIHEGVGKAPDQVRPEKKRPDQPEAEIPTDDSDREWQEWTLLETWDRKLGPDATASDLEAALESVPSMPPVPKRKARSSREDADEA
jgi:hypothetical protein